MAAATSLDGSSLHAPFVRPLAAPVDGAAPSGMLAQHQQHHHHQLAYGAPPMQSHGLMYSMDPAAVAAMGGGGVVPVASSPDAIDALAVATTQYSPPPAASLPNAIGMQMAPQQLHPQSQLVAMDGPTFSLHSQQLLTTLEPMGAAPFMQMQQPAYAAQHMTTMQQQPQQQQQLSFPMQPVDGGYLHQANGFNAVYGNALAAQQYQQQLMMLHAQQQQHQQQQQELLAMQQQQQQLQLQASLAHSNPPSPSPTLHLIGGGRVAHAAPHDSHAKRPPAVSTPHCARSSPRSSVNYKESTPEALYQPSQCFSPLTSAPKTFAFPGLYTTAISKLHTSPHVSPVVSPFAPATSSTSVAHLYSKANMNGITPHPHPQHVQPLPSLHQLPQQPHYAVAAVANDEEEEAQMDEGEGGEEEMEEETETPHANLGDLLSAARGLDSQTKKARKQKARRLAEAAAELQAPAPKKRKSLPDAPVAAPVVIANDHAAPAPVDDLPPPAPLPSKQRRDRVRDRESRKDRPAKPTVVAEDSAPVAAPAAVAAPISVPSPRSKAPPSPVLTGISTTPSTPPHAPKERQTRTSRLAASSDAVEELARELAAANKSAHKPKKHAEEDAAAPTTAVKCEERAAARLEANDSQMKGEPVPAVSASSQPPSPRKVLPGDVTALKVEELIADAGTTGQTIVVDAVKPEHGADTTATVASSVSDTATAPVKADHVAPPAKRSHKKKLPPPGSDSAPPLIPAERIMPLRVRSSRGKDDSSSTSTPSALPSTASAVPSSTSSSSSNSRASSPARAASKSASGSASGEASASTPEEKDASEAARLAELRKAEAANERYMRQYLELYAAEKAFGSSNSRTRHQATVNASPADAVLQKKGRAKVVEFNANSAKRAAAKEMRAVAAQQLRDRAAKEQEESAAAAAADRESTASGNTTNAPLIPSTTSPATSMVGSSASGGSSSRQRSRASGRGTGGGGEVREVASTSSRSKSSRKSVSDDDEGEEQSEKGADAGGSDSSDSSSDSSSSSESSEEEEEPKPKKRLSELDRLHLANQSIFAAEEKARRKALRKQHKAAARAAAAAAAAAAASATPNNAKIDGGAITAGEAAQPSAPPAAAAAAPATITAPINAPKRKR